MIESQGHLSIEGELKMLVAPKIYSGRIRAVEDAVEDWKLAHVGSVGAVELGDFVAEFAELVPATHRTIASYWSMAGMGAIDEFALADSLEDEFERTLRLFVSFRRLTGPTTIADRQRFDAAESAIRLAIDEFKTKRPRLSESAVRAALEAAKMGRVRAL